MPASGSQWPVRAQGARAAVLQGWALPLYGTCTCTLRLTWVTQLGQLCPVGAGASLASDVDLDAVARLTQGTSGADIRVICRWAGRPARCTEEQAPRPAPGTSRVAPAEMLPWRPCGGSWLAAPLHSSSRCVQETLAAVHAAPPTSNINPPRPAAALCVGLFAVACQRARAGWRVCSCSRSTAGGAAG